jgi:hypothetical protein
MERRRFVPSSEGLEKRDLPAGLFGANANTLNHAAQDVPVTFRQKEVRIEHLPFYIESLQPGRFLSQANIQKLQADLFAITTELRKPNPQTLVDFNNLQRKLVPKASLSKQDAITLNNDFEAALSSTGATPTQAANLTDDLLTMAKIDSQSRQPVFLSTNDYSLILQTILGIGRPIQIPKAPELSAHDGTRTITGFAVTRDHNPTLVGTYGAGGTVGIYAGDPNGGFNSSGVIMQIIDDSGTVYGSGLVNPKNGDYTIKLTNTLNDGVYIFRVRATDAEGFMSNPSPPYHLKVFSPGTRKLEVGLSTPAGPLGLR